MDENQTLRPRLKAGTPPPADLLCFLGYKHMASFLFGISMRRFRNGMFLATLEGVLYKTVSVQLSSRDCNEN